MPSPSVTYTFSNSTVADASQVNQNFTDLINGVSDGTKDISVSALTAAGNVSFTGSSITLGNASSDDLTITASLASTISIKTTNSYNIGSSTLGLAGIYFGANSQTVRIVGSGSMSATWTLTLPVTAGTANYALTTNGSGVTAWTAWSTIAWAATSSALGTVYLPGSQIYAHTPDGHGGSSSGDTTVRNFTTATSAGSGITRTARTTTAGEFYTISQAGVYTCTYVDTANAVAVVGLTVNSAHLSTAIDSTSFAFGTERFAYGSVPSIGAPGVATGTIFCAANDIIRAQDDTTCTGSNNRFYIFITQVFRTS